MIPEVECIMHREEYELLIRREHVEVTHVLAIQVEEAHLHPLDSDYVLEYHVLLNPELFSIIYKLSQLILAIRNEVEYEDIPQSGLDVLAG